MIHFFKDNKDVFFEVYKRCKELDDNSYFTLFVVDKHYNTQYKNYTKEEFIKILKMNKKFREKFNEYYESNLEDLNRRYFMFRDKTKDGLLLYKYQKIIKQINNDDKKELYKDYKTMLYYYNRYYTLIDIHKEVNKSDAENILDLFNSVT